MSMRGGFAQGSGPRGRGGYAGGAHKGGNNNNNRAGDGRAVMGAAGEAQLFAASSAAAGGGGGGAGNVPSDTLLVRVSSVVQPVTDDLMRRVFDSAGVAVRQLRVDAPVGAVGDAAVYARFADVYAAERALNALNGRNIFNNANKMTITYANSSSSSDGSAGGEVGGGAGGATAPAVLASPPHMAVGYGAGGMPAMMPPQPPMLPMATMPGGDMATAYAMSNSQPHHTHYQHNVMPSPQQMGMMYGGAPAGLPFGGDAALALPPQMPPYATQSGMAPYMPGMPPFPPQQQQQPQPMLPNAPAGVPLPQVGNTGGRNSGGGGLTVTVGGRAVGRVRGGGRGRGGGGSAVAGVGGGYNVSMPYMPAPGMMPGGYNAAAMMMGGAGGGMLGMPTAGPMVGGGAAGAAAAVMGLPGMASAMGSNISNAPTVFISVTSVPADEPLQSVFVLLEAYGGVVSIRRNHNKKEIMTIKMASIEDADQVIRYVQRVPLGESSTLSSKRFANFTERHPCTDDGDPLSLETAQFDFTASRHRSPAQRSKSAPTSMLRVTGCAAYSEADLMTYLNDHGFYPEHITKDDDGAFTVQVADARTAVRLLIRCHGNVCNQERTNVIFIDGPKTAASAAAATTTTTTVAADGTAAATSSPAATTTDAAKQTTASRGDNDIDDEEQQQQQQQHKATSAVLQQ